MGTYLNPGNGSFTEILNEDYVDKSGLIGLINRSINTPRKLVCISRPRRFGKSFAAKMLCAYYDKTCDSGNLFDNLRISESKDYKTHLNRYDVVYLDMSYIKTFSDDFKRVVPYINDKVMAEIKAAYPGIKEETELPGAMIEAAEISGNKFIMIIDEWDAPIRENCEVEKNYLDFLRTLFKSSGTTDKIFSAVYMTGILPVKKDGSQSALSDFKEYTMLSPGGFAEYVGFTEHEVKSLCKKYDVDYMQMKHWYDGYNFKQVGDIYNPNSVMEAIYTGEFDTYWSGTSSIDSLLRYISYDYMGLKATIAGLIGGMDAEVSPLGFSNDLVSFRDRDDVLTLLIHLGYLAFDKETGTARIPNEEIRLEFQKAIRVTQDDETIRRVAESRKLIEDTVHMDAEAVADRIEIIHRDETAVMHYNNEHSLRSVIKLAYFAYKDNYSEFKELPSGNGFADMVYIPKKGSFFPALVVELKWNKSAEGAISQIKKKHYPEKLKGFGGEILLVGINYDKDKPAGERKHSCVIEKCQ